MIARIIAYCACNRFLVFGSVLVLTAWGGYALKRIPIDAIPDLSDTQVIIYSTWDRPPDIIEDQVTYPIISAMLGTPKVKDIRGISDFGFSYVYVIFEEGTDLYWARSRTLEYLSKITPQLPEGVQTELGPDATGVGWVYQYALVDKSGTHSLADLRSLQDWVLRYQLQSVPGVSEVASVGGFQKEYQVQLNPALLLAYKIPITKVISAIQKGNTETGARLFEVAGTEYMIRGRGYVKNIKDLANLVVAQEKGIPIYLKNIAKITTGPKLRRGVSDLDGEGDTVGGIIVMRHGENASHIIADVKQKLESLIPSLPKGVELITTYDRSDLIQHVIQTLMNELTLEIIVVSLVILFFLLHFSSAAIPIVTLPLAVLISFIPMYYLGISANAMSLGGIAIAIGAMVDAAIVMVENCHKHLEAWNLAGRPGSAKDVIISAIQEVGPSAFFSLLIIAVAFFPIFAFEAQEGRLFKPLAYTKNLSMIVAALLAITLAPALRVSFLPKRESPSLKKPRGLRKILGWGIRSESEHPISRLMFRWYDPMVRWVVNHPYLVIILTIAALLCTIPVYFRIGQEFMPPLNEGSILYMPTTNPGISITEAQNLLTRQDRILKSFPEVERVFGKAGRAQTATDPAPLSMVETTVLLKPQREWPAMPRWYDTLPAMLAWPFALIEPRFKSWDELINEMDTAMQFPGTTNAWTMPIRNRIDMLLTGIRTPIGIKVMGDDLTQVEKVAIELEKILSPIAGTRSVFAERVTGGYFLDFHFGREKLARYGIELSDAQDALASAVGGFVASQTIEGRERYGISVRYARDFRSTRNGLEHVLIPTASGTQIPLGTVANIEMQQGPAMIRNENGLLTSYVYIDIGERDISSYVAEAKVKVSQSLSLPPSTYLSWAGQYEHMQRVQEKLWLVIPLTLFLILLLLYMNTRSWIKTGIILLAVPFSAIGAIWLLYLLGYHISTAVWVGIIALLGVDAETAIFMLLYLDLAYTKQSGEGRMHTWEDLTEAIRAGAAKRLRPKVMTVACLIGGLLPIMWASTADAGADVIKRIAAPMLGGIVTSFLMELLVYPVIFALWKWHGEVKAKCKG